MENDIEEFCAMVDDRFSASIKQLAAVIEQNDPQADRQIGKMMSSDGLLYNQQGIMKYAITCHTQHLSLHLMPIYCYADIHAKHSEIIRMGKFKKGCVNFSKINELPIEQISVMIADCAAMPYPTQYQLDKKLK